MNPRTVLNVLAVWVAATVAFGTLNMIERRVIAWLHEWETDNDEPTEATTLTDRQRVVKTVMDPRKGSMTVAAVGGLR